MLISLACSLQFVNYPPPPSQNTTISSFLRSTDLFSGSKRQCVALYRIHAAVCCRYALIAISKQSGNGLPANIPPWILELIFRLSGRGLSQRAISRNTRVSQCGISKVLRRVGETGRTIQRPHGHRLRITTPREDRALIRIMSNRLLSSSRIREELIRRTGRRVSAHTVQRRLVTAGYHSSRPSRCPTLTHDHHHRRCLWARRHWNWNHQYHVIFADESRFSHYHCDDRARVRRHVGERLLDCCIHESDGNVGPSFMVWGAFHASGKSEPVVVDGTINQQRYTGILR